MLKELIVLAAPRVHDAVYRDQFMEIVQFQINYAKLILGKNSVVVLAHKDTIPYFTGQYPNVIQGRLPSENILEANIHDIWIRDFGTINQANPVKTGYLPEYYEKEFHKQTQNTFLDFLKQSGIELVGRNLEEKRENLAANSTSLEYYPEIVIEGGNVVYDFAGNAIMTDRFLTGNKQFQDRKSAENVLKNALGFSKVVIISQGGDVEEDTTGHADMMLSFIDDSTIAYSCHLSDSKRKLLVSELKSGLGENIKLVELPSYYLWEKDPFIKFSSGCGIHANAMTTKGFIYMPTFGHDPISQSKGYTTENDEKVFQIIQGNTKKHVVKVPVPYNVCILGGSVRCLSMQIEGPIADKLISLAANKQ